MSMPLFSILYVHDALASAAFYQKALEISPVESAPTFAMFRLPDGHMLGLWSRSGVKPTSGEPGQGTELAFTVPDLDTLESTQSRWIEAGARSIQEIEEMDFGTNFMVADPDGHRLRAFIPR